MKQYEQAKQQLTTPKARNGHDYIPSAQVCAESACMVGKEKLNTPQIVRKGSKKRFVFHSRTFLYQLRNAR